MTSFNAVIRFSLSIMLILFGMGIGLSAKSERMQREAVKAGAAYYAADADGAPEFKWRDPRIAEIMEK